MMRALVDYGLTAHIYLRVYNKMVHWPENGSLADDLYFRHVVARYQGFSNVVWDFSKESYNEPDKAYLTNRLRLVQAQDAHGRLVTTTTCSTPTRATLGRPTTSPTSTTCTSASPHCSGASCGRRHT